jgi:copper homeostasis protein
LLEGGLTPSAGMVRVARSRIGIGLQVMIRPRGGDFCYSDAEFEAMCLDVAMARAAGANGVVFGILLEDGSVDEERSRVLISLARPLDVTFHRAFDMARSPFHALETLVALGVDRVLTSGQEASALEGLELIAELTQRARGRIVVMPGGGIHERSIGRIVATSGAREVHVAALRPVEGRMRFRNGRCFMGGELRPPEFSVTVTDADRVRELVALASGARERAD